MKEVKESVIANEWDGEERRETRRRYDIDRRLIERRKRYFISIMIPIIIGVTATALISWGAYVTHVTYTISAKYETNFVQHITARAEKDARLEHELELLRTEYTYKLSTLRDEVNDGLKEIRDTNNAIYKLLLQHQSMEVKAHP